MQLSYRRAVGSTVSTIAASLATLGLLSPSVHAQTPTATRSIVYSFGVSDGRFPLAGLIQGSDGNFYGTTSAGGSSDLGTAFKLTPAGVLTTLHSFSGGSTDGSAPRGSLVQDSSGNLYGTTSGGGTWGAGTVFKITSAGTYSVLYSFYVDNFYPAADGKFPYAGLVLGTDGDLYGTTLFGGVNVSPYPNDGNIFKITTSGSLSNLFFFSGSGIDGQFPRANLIQASDGYFYGTTYGDDSYGTDYGTVFKYSSGSVTTLHTFAPASVSNGAFLYGAMVEGNDGALYGTTANGGISGHGTLFKVTTGGTFTLLYQFDDWDGNHPHAGLIQGTDGNFYGTTAYGGSGMNYGVVFQMTPGGTVTPLSAFGGGSEGAQLEAGLVQGSDGNFYGTAAYYGASGGGTVYKVSVSTVALSSLTSAASSPLATPFSVTATIPFTTIRPVTIPVTGSDGSSGTITIGTGNSSGSVNITSLRTTPGTVTYSATYGGVTQTVTKTLY